MTRIRGKTIYEAECCGRQYAATSYASMNFMCSELWSDGWREGSLMPDSDGLWQCGCGQYHYWYQHMRQIGLSAQSDLPHLNLVPEHRLPQCIEQTRGTPLEVYARLAYWRSQNHEYREAFYALREAQQLIAKRDESDWHLANPDTRTWWQKLKGKPAPAYPHAAPKPIAMPAFTPSALQVENMQQLCELLTADSDGDSDLLIVAELQRQLGQFSASLLTLQQVPEDRSDEIHALIRHLAEAGNPAPGWVQGW